MMGALYREGGSSFNIEIVKHPDAHKFVKAHTEVLNKAIESVKMTDAMRARLTRSNEIFSGQKAVVEMGTAWPSLVDEDGNRRTFNEFLKAVQTVDENYNKNYLRAEYNLVQASAEMAGKWDAFVKDGDRYLLQYRTAGDEKVRKEHAALNRVTLPITDPFWDEYYPPNGWNCRCTVIQVLKGTPVTSHDEAMRLGEQAVGKNGDVFRFNAGKDGKAIPDTHPYFPDKCKGCPYNTIGQSSKDCYTCGGLRKALQVADTEKGYGWELSKNVLAAERKIRTNKIESAHIFNPKTGEKLQSIFGGKKSSVNISSGKTNCKNAVVTHNHPGGLGKTGIGAIGNSFSSADLVMAIEYDMAEIRAVTPTYTFSMKRPSDGWKVSVADFKLAYKQVNDRVHREFQSYIDAAEDSADRSRRIERCNASHYHEVAKRVAKLYGWDYSKKNS